MNGEGNLISGNASDGVYVLDGSNSNVITGNRIGTDATGTFALSNGGSGVLIQDSGSTTVGGPEPGRGTSSPGTGSTASRYSATSPSAR